MTLSREDVGLFYELMWGLQYYVNQKHGLLKNVTTIEQYANIPSQEKLKVRNTLWEHPELLEAYVRENPNSLPADKLEIVKRWRGFINGSFFIFRHLKNGTIFLQEDKAYSVHGIQTPLEDVIPAYTLPQMTRAVLLPFKGKIIYDGLLSGYNVHFGGGIRSNLNHDYARAKKKNRIIYTLEPEYESAIPVKPKKNILPQVEEALALVGKIKGGDSLQNAALALARAGLEIAKLEEDSISPNEADKAYRSVQRVAKKISNLLDMAMEE